MAASVVSVGAGTFFGIKLMTRGTKLETALPIPPAIAGPLTEASAGSIVGPVAATLLLPLRNFGSGVAAMATQNPQAPLDLISAAAFKRLFLPLKDTGTKLLCVKHLFFGHFDEKGNLKSGGLFAGASHNWNRFAIGVGSYIGSYSAMETFLDTNGIPKSNKLNFVSASLFAALTETGLTLDGDVRQTTASQFKTSVGIMRHPNRQLIAAATLGRNGITSIANFGGTWVVDQLSPEQEAKLKIYTTPFNPRDVLTLGFSAVKEVATPFFENIRYASTLDITGAGAARPKLTPQLYRTMLLTRSWVPPFAALMMCGMRKASEAVGLREVKQDT